MNKMMNGQLLNSFDLRQKNGIVNASKEIYGII